MTDPLMRRYQVNMAALDPRPLLYFDKEQSTVFRALSRQRRPAFRQSSTGDSRKFSFKKLEKDKRSKSFSDIRSTVALLNKRPSNHEVRDISHQNGVPKRQHSRDTEQTLHRRVSVTDSHIFLRPSSPVESDEDYFSDDSDSESWRDSVNSDVRILMNKDDEERLHGIFELINTEKNHIRDLKILIRIFKYKLQEKRFINEPECDQLFPALDDLLDSCSKLYTQLKEHMEEEIDSPHSRHNIGSILIDNFSCNTEAGRCIRGAYARLGAKQLIAVKYYREKSKDKAFKSLMDSLESKKVCKRRTYADFLLAVTTRLTKYPPLLKNLFKHTPVSHPDYNSLSEAISVIEEALHYIDNCVRRENERTELKMCNDRFEVKGRCSRELKRFDLTSDKRRLIHRDQVTLHSTKTGSKDTKHRHQLFLFSDYILLLKEKDNKLILNFDDTQCPAIKVKSCLVKNDSLEKLGFMLISNSGRKPDSPQESITKISPTLYRFSADTADKKDTWMRLLTEATTLADEDDVDQTVSNGLSSDERYDDSEESDIDIAASERDPSVSFDSDSVTDLMVSAETSSITTPDSTRHLALEDIEEHHDDYLQEDPTLDYDDDDIERLMTVLRSMNTGGTRVRKPTAGPSSKNAFNRPLPRQTPKSGAAARRAVSLHLAEKQRVEENRRHTTCLSKEELNQAINQTLPANQTLQDNPVRQKSSDSGYAPDDHSLHVHHQPNNSHALMNMRDALLWVLQKSRKKSAEMEELKRENAELKEKVEEQGSAISRLDEEFKTLKAAVMSDQSMSSSQRAPYRPKRTLNTNTYSITEEKSENPQTRV